MKRRLVMRAILVVGCCLMCGCEHRNASPLQSRASTGDANSGAVAEITGPSRVDRSVAFQIPSDADLTAAITRSVAEDKALSTTAHHCSILTENGNVTLRGTVDNRLEQAAIEAKVKSVADVLGVDNQLEIKTG